MVWRYLFEIELPKIFSSGEERSKGGRVFVVERGVYFPGTLFLREI